MRPAAKPGRGPAACTVVAACLALAACAGGSSMPAASAGNAAGTITVSESACGTGWQHPQPGEQTLQIRNVSSSAVEVDLIGSQSGAVYARVEGLGPGTTQPMQVDLGSGSYAFQCSSGLSTYADLIGHAYQVPGNVRGGPGIVPPAYTQMITVTDEARSYVINGLNTVAAQAGTLASDITSGDLTAARSAWLTAHLSWEKLGSAYGMFGNYDDEIDGFPFGLAQGASDPGFTGFYRIEYGLWHGQGAAELTGPAQTLVTDIKSLVTAYPGMELQPPQALGDLALRTHEVLENAMRFQISGEADFGSGSTLATAAAGVTVTQAQLQMLHPLLVGRDSNLSSLQSWLGRLQQLLAAEDTSSGWTPAAGLSASQRELIDSAASQTLELLSQLPVIFEAERQIP
jgi:iron uptake system component EfeO